MSHHLVMFDGHWSSAIKDIRHLTCHLNLQNHMIEGSSNFISGISPTLPTLVAIGIVLVENNGFSLSRYKARPYS